MPARREPLDERPGVVADPVEAISSLGAVMTLAAASFGSSSGNARSTMSTRRSGERVSASVAGMPSSHS